MPRVTHVKSARKDNSICKKGESYYWWKFRYGGKRLSLTSPSRSQLTQSSFLQGLYDLQDNQGFDESGDFEVQVEEFVGQIEALRDECEGSLDNMPEHLKDTSDSGMLLTERIDALQEWQDEMESVDLEVDSDLNDEEKENRHAEIMMDLEGCECNL